MDLPHRPVLALFPDLRCLTALLPASPAWADGTGGGETSRPAVPSVPPAGAPPAAAPALELAPEDRGPPAKSPFVRFEAYDTQAAVPQGFTAAGAFDIREVTMGASYRPIREVVVKADDMLRHPRSGADENQANFGIGFMY